MQRCVAPRSRALSLFLLPPSWNYTPGPSCTFAPSDSAWLCAVRTKARVGPGTVCLPALCSGEPLRHAGNSSFQPRPSEKCDSHQWWANGPNKCTVAKTKRASTWRRGPERRLRARVQCPWQCCQPGALPFSAVRKNPVSFSIIPIYFLGSPGIT